MKIILILFISLFIFSFANENIVASKDFELHEEILNFWTEERMKSAVPMDIMVVDLNNETYAPEFEKQKYISFEDFNQGGTRECPNPGTHPYATVGKLFFNTGGGQSSCTATSVGGDVILTAGHCVSNARGGFYGNIMFCPQFRDGQCPRGRFTASRVVCHARYHNGGEFARDVAFAKMSAGLQGAVGAIGILVNVGRDQQCDAMGYPGNVGGGQRMIMSTGRQSMGHTNRNPPTVKFPSRMTYGSSGGSWIVQGRNVANSNVSYGNPQQDPNNFYGPYYDGEIQSLRNSIS